MMEHNWVTCSDPQVMLERLHWQGHLSDRKARHLAVACCRRIWPLLDTEWFRRAVEMGERFADGLTTREVLRATEYGAWKIARRENPAAGAAAYCMVAEDEDAYSFTGVAAYAARQALAAAADAVRHSGTTYQEAVAARWAEFTAQAALVRDIFGIPFCDQPTAEPDWRSWNGGAVTHLAQEAYRERRMPEGNLDPGRLAEVASVLEAAGCRDYEILSHLRRPGVVHVRGC